MTDRTLTGIEQKDVEMLRRRPGLDNDIAVDTTVALRERDAIESEDHGRAMHALQEDGDAVSIRGTVRPFGGGTVLHPRLRAKLS